MRSPPITIHFSPVDLELRAGGVSYRTVEVAPPVAPGGALERALQRAQRHVDLALGEQLLHDDGVAGGGAIQELARQRLLVGIERPRVRPRLNCGSGAATQVPAHAVARDAQLTRDPLAAPAKLLQ